MRKLRLKTCGFLRLIRVFYLFPFSPSDVFIYASRSKNENFCSKSVRPEELSHLGITNKKRQKHCQKNSVSVVSFCKFEEIRQPFLIFPKKRKIYAVFGTFGKMLCLRASSLFKRSFCAKISLLCLIYNKPQKN